MRPAIGPAAPWWWQGSSSISPDSTRAWASASFVAFPSKIKAPVIAPCIGPEASFLQQSLRQPNVQFCQVHRGTAVQAHPQKKYIAVQLK